MHSQRLPLELIQSHARTPCLKVTFSRVVKANVQYYTPGADVCHWSSNWQNWFLCINLFLNISSGLTYLHYL